MIKTILVSIETGMHKLIVWEGWTDQDRTMMRDMIRQVHHLQRRRETRLALLRKGGR